MLHVFLLGFVWKLEAFCAHAPANGAGNLLGSLEGPRSPSRKTIHRTLLTNLSKLLAPFAEAKSSTGWVDERRAHSNSSLHAYNIVQDNHKNATCVDVTRNTRIPSIGGSSENGA